MNKVFYELYSELTGTCIGENNYNEGNIIEHLTSFETGTLLEKLKAMLQPYREDFNGVALRLSNCWNQGAYEYGMIFKFILEKWDKRVLTKAEKEMVYILVAFTCSYIEAEFMNYHNSIYRVAEENGYKYHYPVTAKTINNDMHPQTKEEKEKYRKSFAVAFCEESESG